MSKWGKTAVAAVMFLSLLFFASNYKMRMDANFAHYNELNTLIRDAKDHSLQLKNSIKESVLYQYYNNDGIFASIRRINDLLYRIETSKIGKDPNFPKSKAQYLSIKEEFTKMSETVDTLASKNAKIKNSLTYLTTLSGRLEGFSYQYHDDVMQMAGYFFRLKNSLDMTALEERKFYETLRAYRFEDERLQMRHALIVRHADLLMKEFPTYIAVFESLVRQDDIQSYDRLLAYFIDESNTEREALNIEFDALTVFSLLALGVIVYFIFYTEQEKQKIIRLQEEFNRSVTTDSLTKLKNRLPYFQDRDRLAHPQLVLVDIIDFSHINTVLGTDGGDVVLQKIAEQLKTIDGDSRHVGLYKVGVDEFGFLFDGEALNVLEAFAASVIEKVEGSPIVYEGIKIPINVHIGIADKLPLLLHAHTCINELKNRLGQKVLFFSDEFDQSEATRKNIDMIHTIKKAIDSNHVTPLFQPIVDLQTKRTYKHEALVRIKENGGYISPYFFLDISKKIKLYKKITRAVVDQVIRKAREEELNVSINLSIEDVLEEEISRYIISMMEANPVVASRITFEVVESEKITDKELLLDFIGQVKALGCRIAIDDFGSGYSNFDYLLQFNADYIKIDGSLIKEIDRNENARMVVKTIVDFAQAAGMKTVAEFVHNEAIDRVVTEMGIDYGQGFYYSEPVEL